MSQLHEEMSPKRKLSDIAIVFIVFSVAAVIVAIIVVVLHYTSRLHPDQPTTPQIGNWTASGVFWCQTQYRAAYGSGPWSRPSPFTPESSAGFNNVNPVIFLSNAYNRRSVRWQRQLARDGSTWEPIHLTRVNGTTFVDISHPCLPLQPEPPGTPASAGWQSNEGHWCGTSYSVKVINSGNLWSPWSEPFANPAGEFPRLFVPNLHGQALAWRRRTSFNDSVGDLVYPLETTVANVFVDYQNPFAGVLVVNEGNAKKFFVSYGDAVLVVEVKAGFYTLPALLDELSTLVTEATTTNNLFELAYGLPEGTIAGRFQQLGESPMTFRLRTAVDGPPPNAALGLTLNTLLGFTAEVDPPSTPLQTAQIAPTQVTREYTSCIGT